jgi:hypothetical protein
MAEQEVAPAADREAASAPSAVQADQDAANQQQQQIDEDAALAHQMAMEMEAEEGRGSPLV